MQIADSRIHIKDIAINDNLNSIKCFIQKVKLNKDKTKVSFIFNPKTKISLLLEYILYSYLLRS